MAQQKFKTVDIVIIVLFFVVYMIGYALNMISDATERSKNE